MKDLKDWHIIHLTLSIVTMLVLFALGQSSEAISFLIGALMIQINIALLTWIFSTIETKKSVAWSFLAIVSKYALLIWFLKFTDQYIHYDLVWLILGVGFLTVSSVGLLIRKRLSGLVSQRK